MAHSTAQGPARHLGLSRGRLAISLAAAVALAACGSTSPTPTAAPASGTANSVLGATSSGGPSSPAAASAGASTSAASGAGNTATTSGVSARVTAALLSARLPTPLSRAVMVADGTVLLVLGGVTPSGTTPLILRLDPATGSFTRVGRLKTPVHDASGAALGQGWLVVGGGQTLASSVVQDVSPIGTKVSVSTSGHLPSARADGGSTSAGGVVIVAGGGRGGVPDPTVLMTRDGAHFTVFGQLPVAVRYPAVAALGDQAYLFGGTTTSGASNVIQAVDAKTGTIGVVGSLPYALTQATAFSLGGRILIAGGMRAGRPSFAILAFDPATGRTTVVGRLPVALADAAAAVVGSTAYLVGGETGKAFLDSVIAIH